MSVEEAKGVLARAYATYPRVALVASFQAESSVLIHLASQVVPEAEVLTIDTGRLPEETFAAMEAFRARFRIRLRVLTPEPGQVAEMVGRHGPNLFYSSVELRRRCCEVRKSLPLARALTGYDAWIAGVRREQGATRAEMQVVGPDPVHPGVVKIAPLAGWTLDEVWGHIRAHRLPVHPLYAQGYSSIGCAPCTRPTRPGEDERAGRWYWEAGAVKECGINWQPEAAR